MSALFDFDLFGDQKDTTRTPDSDRDGPLGPALGGAGARVDADDGQSVRAQLIALAFEAEQVKREIIEADVPAGQALGRAQPLFLAARTDWPSAAPARASTPPRAGPSGPSRSLSGVLVVSF